MKKCSALAVLDFEDIPTGIYAVDGENEWRWRMKSSQALRRVRASRAWEALDAVRLRLKR